MSKPRKPDGDFHGELDISEAMRGWPFHSGQVNVRLIRGKDHRPKIQLRLDLGLLQMEVDGRPDGKRPHRASSELDYHKKRYYAHVEQHGDDAGFVLTARDCQALRDESALFYHRYLALFVLEQYERVIRDTQHNLDILAVCWHHGQTDFDRTALEQYQPYILMMNARAKACEALRQGFVLTAIAYLRGGIKSIARLFHPDQRKSMLRESSEARVLLEMIKQIRAQMPPDPRTDLRKRLQVALKMERYEEAAKLRDELTALSTTVPHGTITPGTQDAAIQKLMTMGKSGRGRKRSKSDGG